MAIRALEVLPPEEGGWILLQTADGRWRKVTKWRGGHAAKWRCALPWLRAAPPRGTRLILRTADGVMRWRIALALAVLLQENPGAKFPAWARSLVVEEGPYYILEILGPGESRPKETDEVAESSDDPSEDSDTHGGDGNSGEVDSPAELPSMDHRTGEASAQAPPKPADLSRAGESEGETPRPQKEEAEDRWRLHRPATGTTSPVPELPRGKDVKSLKKALERLFTGFLEADSRKGTGLWEPGPRWDGGRLVREMKSQRWDLTRARRPELGGTARILVAADTSGSCSAASGATVGLCQALTQLWPQLVFVNHGNGAIGEISVQGRTEERDWQDASPEAWQALV